MSEQRSGQSKRERQLRSHARRAAVRGIPFLLAGCGISYGALWWGLDYTGDLVLVIGVLIGGLGLALVLIGTLATAVLAESWVRGHFGRRRRLGRRVKREPATPAPPPPANEKHVTDTEGPHIF
jgi:hypothetical protein